jgi:hypothetical protein
MSETLPTQGEVRHINPPSARLGEEREITVLAWPSPVRQAYWHLGGFSFLSVLFLHSGSTATGRQHWQAFSGESVVLIPFSTGIHQGNCGGRHNNWTVSYLGTSGLVGYVCFWPA